MSAPQNEKRLNILVIDQNRVYAKLVKEIIEKHVRDVSANVATNIWELRRRTAENQYDLVIVDLAVTYEEEEISAELKKMAIPVIAWTPFNREQDWEIKKPTNLKELRMLVPAMLADRMLIS